MQKVKILKQCEYKKGDVVSVDNNEAHRLIDGGFGKLFNYPNKMMKPPKKGYKIK